MESVWPSKFFEKLKFRPNRNRTWLKNDKSYIFPTRFGFSFGLLCLILLYSSFATANNLMYLYTFALVSLGFSSIWITHVNINDITIDQIEIEDGFADSIQHALVNLQNRSRKKRYAITITTASSAPILLEVLNRHEFKQIRIPIGEFPRGEHALPKITIETQFPFSLLNAWKVFLLEKKFQVFPKREGPLPLPLQISKGDSDEGRVLDRIRSTDSEFSGHRKFEDSDSARHIDWKAYARTNRLMVKDYMGFRPQQILIRWSDTTAVSDFELRLSQLALWIDLAEAKGYFYEVKFGKVTLPSNRGALHYSECMRTLAKATREALS